jgi:hypothetical protein
VQISDDHINSISLAAIGNEALYLLQSGDFRALAGRFGYALAFGREIDAAISEDLAFCLTELEAGALLVPGAATLVPEVRYFGPDDFFVAVIECLAPTDKGTQVLVELIVTSKGVEKHVTLEQLSVAFEDLG